MSKLKPLYVIIPGALLPIIVICVFAFVLVPPVTKQIDDVTKQRNARRDKAQEETKVKERLRLAKENLDTQQKDLDRYMRTRSIALSTYQPVQAMIALWFEYQEDLKPVVEDFIQASGCQIVQGAALPAPEMKKPTLGPSNFLRVGTLNLRVRGNMAQLRKLYTSLSTFKRVGTIGILDLTPTAGDELEATIPLTIYILGEGPETAAAAPAAGGAPGMPGAGPPGMPGAGPPGAPTGPPKSGARAPRAGAKAGGGGEDEGGGGGGLKSKRGGGGEDA